MLKLVLSIAGAESEPPELLEDFLVQAADIGIQCSLATGVDDFGIDLFGRLDTGGGNQGRLLGTLGGAGDLVFRGGGRNPELELAPFTLGGDEPNTLAGRITVERDGFYSL